MQVSGNTVSSSGELCNGAAACKWYLPLTTVIKQAIHGCDWLAFLHSEVASSCTRTQ
jgi:hypothetical protein